MKVKKAELNNVPVFLWRNRWRLLALISIFMVSFCSIWIQDVMLAVDYPSTEGASLETLRMVVFFMEHLVAIKLFCFIIEVASGCVAGLTVSIMFIETLKKHHQS